MGTTLENGIYLPDEGERYCYDGLAGNWTALDNHLGNTDIHVTINDKQAWDGHVADATIHVTSADKSKWDAVTSKADDSGVVHNTGNETIDGNKSLLKNLKIKNEDVTRGSTTGSGSKSITFTDVSDNTLAIFSVGKVSNGSTTIGFRVDTTDGSDVNINSQFQFFISKSGVKVINPNVDGDIALGRSSNRWSDVQSYKINALDPSSLGFPSPYTSNRVDISSYITDLSGGNNFYTASANGYLVFTFSAASSVQIYPSNVAGLPSKWTAGGGNGIIRGFIPVIKGQESKIIVKGTTMDTFYFIPCQGNI